MLVRKETAPSGYRRPWLPAPRNFQRRYSPELFESCLRAICSASNRPESLIIFEMFLMDLTENDLIKSL